MLNIVLGGAIFGATAFAFQAARPVNGKMKPWITPRLEPYITVAFVGAASLGVGLILVGVVSVLA
jgi:hypothetical protein